MKKLLAVFCLMAVFLTACGSEETPESGITTVYLYTANVVKMHAENSVFTIDPAFASTGNELLLARLLFSGLIKNTDEGIKGDLATSWKVSEDRLTYTFSLRDNLQFSDGTPLTVHDIQFSWERALRITSPNAYLFENIVGADKILNEETRELEGFGIIDEKTFTVTLTKPDEYFLNKLCHIGASVLKEEELLEYGAYYASPSTTDDYYPLPSGTGAYRISEWLRDKQLSLTANQYYYDTLPSARRLEIDFAASVTDSLLKLNWGELDAVQNVLPSQVPFGIAADDLASINYNNKSFMSIIINPAWQNSDGEMPLSSGKTRLAILQALEDDSLNGQATEGLSFTKTGMTDHWYSLDEDVLKSHDYSQTGKFNIPESLKELPIICGPSPRERQTALTVAQILMQQGIKCSIGQLDYADLLPYMEYGKDFALLIYEYNDKGSELNDFFRLFIQPNMKRFFPIAQDEELTEKQKNQNETYGAYHELLNGTFDDDKQSQRAVFLKIEQELCKQGCLKTLWFNSNSFTFDPKIRNMDTKLSEILN